MMITGIASAQSRNIPDSAKRAVIAYAGGMTITLNAMPTLLAPGANIRNQNNFIIVPSALPEGGALADYTVDFSGQVFRVWLLTQEEAERPRRAADDGGGNWNRTQPGQP